MFTVYYRTRTAIGQDPLCIKTGDSVDRSNYQEVTKIEDVEQLGEAWRRMNIVDGDELPVKLKVRSMMVGDLLHRASDNTLWLCAMIGWRKVRWA